MEEVPWGTSSIEAKREKEEQVGIAKAQKERKRSKRGCRPQKKAPMEATHKRKEMGRREKAIADAVAPQLQRKPGQ